MDFKPDFLIIPYLAVENRNLQPLDRILYGVIYYFERMKYGQCIASNKILAEFAQCSTRSIGGCLSRLEKEGYILCLYNDEKKKDRKEIKTNIQIIVNGGVTSDNVTGYVKQRNGLREVTYGVTSDNVQISNIDKEDLNNKKDNIILHSEQSSQGVQINNLIELFKPVNDGYTRFYKNKTQRKAIEDLLKIKTVEELIKLINGLQWLNRQPYATTIVTPCQLRDRLGEYKAFVQRNQNNKEAKLISL